MSTMIRLDKSALEALFPEGSQARLDLTRAVTAQMVRLVVEKDTTTVRNILLDQGQRIAIEALKDMGIQEPNYFGAVQISESAKQAIREEAVRQANAELNLTVREAIVKRLDELDSQDLQERAHKIIEAAMERELRSSGSVLKTLAAVVDKLGKED